MFTEQPFFIGKIFTKDEECEEMSISVETVHCPNCGAPQELSAKHCEFCGSTIIIRTFNAVEAMSLPQLNKYVGAYKTEMSGGINDPAIHRSIAFCYLKLKLYDSALTFVEKAMQTL
jgi:hypothetical protein